MVGCYGLGSVSGKVPSIPSLLPGLPPGYSGEHISMTKNQFDKLKLAIQEKIIDIWTPEHDASGHHYRYKDYPDLQDSVTTKLGILNKPHLLKWAIRKGLEWMELEERWSRLSGPDREELLSGAQSAFTDIRDDAGSVGGIAHLAVEDYLKEWIATEQRPLDIKKFLKVDTDPRAIASARAFEALCKKKNIIPVASEILVGNRKYSAGTLDILCFYEGQLTLLDLKTSNAVDKISYPLQVAAYVYFFKYMTKIPLSRAKIIHVSKDCDRFDVYTIKNMSTAWKAFKAVCTLYDWIHDKKPKIEKDIKRISL